jgi:choline dehydrogenase-like flavoprotein
VTAEVLIVGSGPAGVSAAWPLLEAGVRVLMIDAATGTPPTSPVGDIGGLRRDPARWAAQFGADLAGLAVSADQSPKLATPLARVALGGFLDANRIEASGFAALGSLGQGGLSAIWGAAATLYDEVDLAGFPFGLDVLADSYRRVMQRIGVSGPKAVKLNVGDAGPAFAPPISRLASAAARRGLPFGMSLEAADNAVLMHPRDGRQGCANCGLCLWGCARGSIYASNQELQALKRFPHFAYRPGVRVVRLVRQGGLPAVEAAGPVGLEALASPRVLLAAGALATTSLVLRALGGLPSAVRLLSNPVAAMAFLAPSLVGRTLPERSFSLAQLAYRLPIDDGQHAAGMLYAADALPLAGIAARLPVSRPTALRLSRALAPALVLATCYLPGRCSDNTMRLSGDAVTIEGRQPEAAVMALHRAGRRLGSALRRLGVWPVPGSLTVAPPGADGHYAGALPMGAPGPAGCDLLGELAGLPGVHVLDGAALPDLPARHCTLTIMANADRIARALAQDPLLRPT